MLLAPSLCSRTWTRQQHIERLSHTAEHSNNCLRATNEGTCTVPCFSCITLSLIIIHTYTLSTFVTLPICFDALVEQIWIEFVFLNFFSMHQSFRMNGFQLQFLSAQHFLSDWLNHLALLSKVNISNLVLRRHWRAFHILFMEVISYLRPIHQVWFPKIFAIESRLSC